MRVFVRSGASGGAAIACALARRTPRAGSRRRIGPSAKTKAGGTTSPGAISSSGNSTSPTTTAHPPGGAAVRLFRDARQMMDLPDALLAQARLRGSLEDCDEALRLAARSTFALMQCDALNLRARLRREARHPADAAKDARAALEIAERCGYYWGRRDALRELRDTAAALDDAAMKDHWEAAERALAAKMQPRIDEALAIEAAHDRAMGELYGKKKRER